MIPAIQSFAIVPAAGRSVRMGEPKLLLRWGETTILEQMLSIWRAAGVTRTIVVAHPNDRELATIARDAGAHVVVPDRPPPQMKDSVQAALTLIAANFHPTAVDVWLLAPADVPTMSANVIIELLARHDPNAAMILVPTHGSRRGHPVLLPWNIVERVYALRADQGINALVEEGPTRYLELGPDATPSDIDTPSELSRQRKFHEEKFIEQKDAKSAKNE